MENANGNGNIAARYQYKYQEDNYDMIFVFCDTERKPYNDFILMKDKINQFHGDSKGEIADKIVYYANPCTLQIVIKHFEDIKLTKSAKSKNADLVYEHTQIKNYGAHKEQIEEMMSFINKNNYSLMKDRIDDLVNDFNLTGSTNFIILVKFLESDDISWIREINNLIENCD